MRACNCDGILSRAQAAFDDRVLGWAALPSIAGTPHRLVVVHVRCEACGMVWRMELRALPGHHPASEVGATAPEKVD